jgi:hypothetical protein
VCGQHRGQRVNDELRYRLPDAAVPVEHAEEAARLVRARARARGEGGGAGASEG